MYCLTNRYLQNATTQEICEMQFELKLIYLYIYTTNR